MNHNPFRCRYAPSLGALEGTPEQVWGTKPYRFLLDRNRPTVFFGLYDLRDYVALALHRGRKYVLWAGSDIRNLEAGFLLNDGKLRWLSMHFKGWFSHWVKSVIGEASNWVENGVEAEALKRLGIEVNGICPSYMGDPRKVERYYRHGDPIHVFACAPEGREDEYGWGVIQEAAKLNRKIIYHLYGGSQHYPKYQANIVWHNRVSKERMNADIKNYQAALRLNKFDGFSEIVAKGVLGGKHVVSTIAYPFVLKVERKPSAIVAALDAVRRNHAAPPHQVREFYVKLLNSYPWKCV